MGGGDKALSRSAASDPRPRRSSASRRRCAGICSTPTAIPPASPPIGLPVVADSVPDFAGPLAGDPRRARLGRRRTGRTSPGSSSVPGDCPFLPRDLVARLHRGAAAAEGTPLACAHSGDWRHPVVGLWPVALRDDLRHAADGGGCAQDRALDRAPRRRARRLAGRAGRSVLQRQHARGCRAGDEAGGDWQYVALRANVGAGQSLGSRCARRPCQLKEADNIEDVDVVDLAFLSIHAPDHHAAQLICRHVEDRRAADTRQPGKAGVFVLGDPVPKVGSETWSNVREFHALVTDDKLRRCQEGLFLNDASNQQVVPGQACGRRSVVKRIRAALEEIGAEILLEIRSRRCPSHRYQRRLNAWCRGRITFPSRGRACCLSSRTSHP